MAMHRQFCEQCGIGTAHDGRGCRNCRDLATIRGGNAPILWQSGEWSNITNKHIAVWESAYPACDIRLQLMKMTAWLYANPAKARKSNWERFIVNWLTREQDRGGDIQSNRPNANISRVAAKPGKYANVGETVDANFPANSEAD